MQILTDFFLYDKKFPIVDVSLSSRSNESYLNAYYRYGLNNYFGAYPLNLKNSIEPVFFYISNLSKILLDFSNSFDYIYEYYFTPKLTKLTIKKTKEYFLPILQNRNAPNKDPFIEYPELWNVLANYLKIYYLELAKEIATTYFSFMKAKVNRIYAVTIQSIDCREEDEALARNFLDKIKKIFYDAINSSKNNDLRVALLNMPFSALTIQGLNTISSEETFYNIYSIAEKNSYPAAFSLDELTKEFNNTIDRVINILYDNIFYENSILINELSNITDTNGNVLGSEYAKGLLNYIK